MTYDEYKNKTPDVFENAVHLEQCEHCGEWMSVEHLTPILSDIGGLQYYECKDDECKTKTE